MPEIVQPTSQIVVQLIREKMDAINTLVRDNQFTTRNDQTRGVLLSSVQLAITDYLNALQSSDTSISTNLVKRGNVNSSALYNAFWTSVQNDLSVLYAEANNIGQILVNHHNYITADIQNILIQLKIANSTIENYSLLTNSPISNQQTFVQKFTDTTKIDVNSALLGDTQCNIDTIEGVVTLGITQSNTVQETDVANTIIGSANSNGTIYGNTQLLDIIDSSNFKLFQYELTSQAFVPNKLTLDFTIKLKNVTILNFLRIVPNNFGTKTWPTITALDVSEDGVNFTSIRDVLLAVNNDPTQFILAPYTSNFAGEGRYSFLPERVLYIHFTIEQTTPYFDFTRNLYRWVIGIKDIELTSNRFAASSQMISLPYTFTVGVEKISIDGDELPPMSFNSDGVSSETNILHDISVDDGMTWKTISPEYLTGNAPPNAPQILNVNNVDSQLNPSDASSINTNQEVTSVRYRLRLSANPSIINDTELLPYFSPVVKQLQLKVFTQEVI